jgi:hypothetical protein
MTTTPSWAGLDPNSTGHDVLSSVIGPQPHEIGAGLHQAVEQAALAVALEHFAQGKLEIEQDLAMRRIAQIQPTIVRRAPRVTGSTLCGAPEG